MKESIELFKPWEAKRANTPGMVSRKLDGVPVRIRNIGGHIFAYTRQNEKVESIAHILEYASLFVSRQGASIVGELYVEGMPFKDISGLVRQKRTDVRSRQLVLHLHDFDIRAEPLLSYEARMADAMAVLRAVERRFGMTDTLPIQMIPAIDVASSAAAEEAFRLIMHANPGAEGAVWHDVSKTFSPGDRRWTGMKMKPEPTLDVMVVGFEEAVDKFKVKKGMIGRVEIELNTYRTTTGKLVTTRTGIGPGSLTHKERKTLWLDFVAGRFKPRIAEVKYMLDDTYDGLRQPTFVRWRDDKQEADRRELP